MPVMQELPFLKMKRGNEVRYGYEYLQWDNGAVFDGGSLSEYDLKDSFGQFEMILLDKNIVYDSNK